MVVTGASSGIGAAAAESLAADGATVVLVARRADALADVAARCGGRALVMVADVTVRDEVRRVVSDAIARAGRIDVWINNAGRGITRPPSELTDEDVDAMMRVTWSRRSTGCRRCCRTSRPGATGTSSTSRPCSPGCRWHRRARPTPGRSFPDALTAMMRDEVQATIRASSSP